jgi:hypothetical protein
MSTGTGSGSLGLDLKDDDSIRDLAGNKLGGTGLGNGDFIGQVYTVDRTPPSVTINRAGGQSDPTNASPINFRVAFSEGVTGFTASDISLAGGTAGGTRSASITGGPSIYNVAISGMTSDGTVVASIGAGAAQDAAGNASAASTSTDNTVTYDTAPPDTSITAHPANATNASWASYSFSGSDVGGSGVASFQCQLDDGGWSGCTSPKSYAGPLSDGSHTFEVRAIDAASNTDPTPASFT